MKTPMKILALALGLLSCTVQAGTFTTLCGYTAESAVLASEAQELGITWDELYNKTMRIETSPSKAAKKMLEISNGVVQKAYYSWAGMPSKAVRSMAFTTCEVELARAFR